MKSYTDLEQSKKLAEFLSFESADMFHAPDAGVVVTEPCITYCNEERNVHAYKGTIPCWSLAALLSILPILDNRSPIISKTFDRKYRVVYHSTAYEMAIITSDYDNPVDACVAMIELLHEQKLL